ncbi:MAG: thioredoxin family protein [Anaerovoracaceae bacterium]
MKVGKINVDNEMELAVKFQANAIPMLVFIREGQVADVSVGVVPKERIEEMIAK